MNTVLKKFVNESLFDACAALLNHLHIVFNEVTRVPVPFENLYPLDLSKALKEVLAKVDNTFFIGTVDESSLTGGAETLSAEEVTTRASEGKYTGLMIFAVELHRGATLTRTESATLTRGFNRIASAQPVILFIKQGNELALSTCERSEYTQQWRDGEKLGKVSILRGINCNNPHRGHIDILASIGDKTYPNYEELYKHWMEVFSSDLLTKKFYSELSDWYAWAVQVARFPNDLTTDTDDDKFNHESCIRLITRLIFVWFLKQKHLIPEEFFDERYIKEHFIEEFNPHDRRNLLYNPEESKYYRLILQNLFFAMLNCPIVAEGKETPNNRRFRGDFQKGFLRDGYNVNNLMRYKADFKEGGADEFVQMANSHVPFLNGGLFDCLDKKPEKLYYDGFSERKESLEQLYLPDWLFFGEEVGRSIDLSQWYGDNNKKSVSARGIIDILKRYNFTIEENTPLDQEVSLDPELLGKAFENLLASYNPETKTSARKQTGSFYTPREIVQYMVDESLVAHLKRTCGDELEPEYRKLLSYSTEETTLNEEQRKAIMQAVYNCRVLDPACGSGAFPMGILQQLVHVLRQLDPTNDMWKDFMIDLAIEQSKVAFATNEKEEREARLKDIEEAFDKSINDPDYARKLYLIEHCIYGVDIQPIAVQISKLRFFISLVVDQKPTKDAAHNFGIRPLPNLESKFVAANTLIPVGYDASLFESTEEILSKKETLKELNHQIFLAKRNVDKQRLKKDIKETRLELAKAIEDTGFVSQGAAQLLANWDMFDQNASSLFFDSEWMFGVKDGFEIVIGNPPYVVVPVSLYTNYEWNNDLYKMFFELSLKKLCRSKGIVSMITPKFFLLNRDDNKMRLYFMNRVDLLSIATCNPFDAVTENAITIIRTDTPQSISIPYLDYDAEAKSFVRYDDLDKEYCKTNKYNEMTFGLKAEIITILQKMYESGKPLGSLTESKRGAEVSKNFLRNNSSGIETLIGQDMRKYSISWNKTYLPTAHKEYRRLKNFFDSEAIYLRRVDSMLEATISFGKHYGYNKNVYGIRRRLDCDYGIRYLLACINSKVVDFYYKKKFSTKKTDVFPEIQTYLYEQLPIPSASKDVQNRIENLVDEILTAKLQSHGVETTSQEQEVDNLFYHLYGLTYDEVLIVDPETPITKEEYNKTIVQYDNNR
ncbi:MAG: Eco57I restriction-modification methylase domain-containing protein [Alloprevotella sp.]|nr:Eco57I restriction-modification methylase domain-containing protein [Alloprevotella sp.]